MLVVMFGEFMEDKMEKNKKGDACCTSHRCEILGIIFLALATILTLLTFSGVGILGMFVVGTIFCCHKHWGRRCQCGCHCCNTDTSCSVPNEPKKEPTAKRATTKK